MQVQSVMSLAPFTYMVGHSLPCKQSSGVVTSLTKYGHGYKPNMSMSILGQWCHPCPLVYKHSDSSSVLSYVCYELAYQKGFLYGCSAFIVIDAGFLTLNLFSFYFLKGLSKMCLTFLSRVAMYPLLNHVGEGAQYKGVFQISNKSPRHPHNLPCCGNVA